MGTEPKSEATAPSPASCSSWRLLAIAASAVFGLVLIADQAVHMSATYDEVTYLRVAAHWWRTGEQLEVTRLGSPLTFWKLQEAPTLWVLDQVGLGSWIDDPIAHQEQLLPVVRIGASWVWLVALLIAANWARQLYGPRAMVLASVAFALSPNLLAHGALVTMELPLLACSSAMLHRFWLFLRSGKPLDFYATAALGGLGMSLKFTTVLIPPILGLIWAVDLALRPGDGGRLRRLAGIAWRVGWGMVRFGVVMVVTNLVITGFATIRPESVDGIGPWVESRLDPKFRPIARRVIETPLPADWVGFARQASFQRRGGMSYLFGERRTTGWTLYYPITLAVKVPLGFWLLVVGRALIRGRSKPGDRAWVLPAFAIAFLLVAMFGSKRNYGYRYLVPMAVPAVVWGSGLVEGARRSRWCAAVGLAGMAWAVWSIHPHELTYFNEAAGGPIGGRRVLADSNLDWGQGAKALARLQRIRPEYRDLTLFYFGDTDPAFYGVEGRRFLIDAHKGPADLPAELAVSTRFLAVSASLQWGPWGPAGYFKRLDGVEPVAFSDDRTIAIYRAADLARPVRTGRGPG
jgi:hypothetical protein